MSRIHRLGKLPYNVHQASTLGSSQDEKYRYYDYVLLSPSAVSSNENGAVATTVHVTTFDILSGRPTTELDKDEFDPTLKSTFEGWEEVASFHTVLGYVVVGHCGHLLVATKVEEAGRIFDATVYHVVEMKLIDIRLPRPFINVAHRDDLTKLQQLRDHIASMPHVYYYCDELDLTWPVGTAALQSGPDHSYLWNEELASSLNKRVASNLLQGYACTQPLHNALGREVGQIGLIQRRCVMNSGRRTCRGLNAESCPANEYECEVVIWEHVPKREGTFTSFVYRRGTVPLYWRSKFELNSIMEDILVRRDCERGAEWYYHNLLRRYDKVLVPANRTLHIHALNLLRVQACPQEERLGRAYESTIEGITPLVKDLPRDGLDNMDEVTVHVTSHDWHRQMSSLGLEKHIELLWMIIQSEAHECGFSSGTYNSVTRQFTLTRRQKSLFRINCKDSLDRANVGSFYVAVHMIMSMIKSPDLFAEACLKSRTAPAVPKSYAQVRDTFNPSVAQALVQMFLEGGDRCSELYMHSVALDRRSICYFIRKNESSMPGRNLTVGLQRQVENNVFEATRTLQQDAFLNRFRGFFPHPAAVSQSTSSLESNRAVLARNIPNAARLVSLGSTTTVRVCTEHQCAFVYYREAESAAKALQMDNTELAIFDAPAHDDGLRWFVDPALVEKDEIDQIISPDRVHTFRAIDAPRGAVCATCRETIYVPSNAVRCTCCGLIVHKDLPDSDTKCLKSLPKQLHLCRAVVRSRNKGSKGSPTSSSSNASNVGAMSAEEERMYYTAESPKEPVGFYRVSAIVADSLKNTWSVFTR
eukprot:PhM_4_TR9787/c0_g1_i1/m.79118